MSISLIVAVGIIVGFVLGLSRRRQKAFDTMCEASERQIRMYEERLRLLRELVEVETNKAMHLSQQRQEERGHEVLN